MTIVAIEKADFKYNHLDNPTPQIQIVADSRISKDEFTTSDIAPKIIPIAISSKDQHNVKRHFQNYGFCYCGSVAAALNTHAMAQYVLTNLFSNDPSAAPPSVEEVGKIYAEIGTTQMKDFAGRLSPDKASSALFEGVIVGFSGGQIAAYHIKPEITDSFEVQFTQIDLATGPFRMGSGSADFDRIRMERLEKAAPLDILQIVEEIIKSRTNRTVGGHLQLAKADHEGFDQLAVLEIPDGEEFADITVLGVNLADVPRPSGYKIGQSAIKVGEAARNKSKRGEDIRTRS